MQAPRQIVTTFRPIPLDVPEGMMPNEFFNSTENLNDLIHNNGLLVNPEDLVLCRAVYDNFRNLAPRIPVAEIVRFLDGRPDLTSLVEPLVAPTLSKMYL